MHSLCITAFFERQQSLPIKQPAQRADKRYESFSRKNMTDFFEIEMGSASRPPKDKPDPYISSLFDQIKTRLDENGVIRIEMPPELQELF
ncbi:MAG: hypothetical protein DMG13_32580, partial [Acidobacteria bacterium]